MVNEDIHEQGKERLERLRQQPIKPFDPALVLREIAAIVDPECKLSIDGVIEKMQERQRERDNGKE